MLHQCVVDAGGGGGDGDGDTDTDTAPLAATPYGPSFIGKMGSIAAVCLVLLLWHALGRLRAL